MNTPLAEQLKIVLVGLRNSGKSSLMNRLFEKPIAIVSDTPGTTTDPVTRSYELGELGPVAITDTAGFDDLGELGAQRIQKTFEQTGQADLLILVTPCHREPHPLELDFIHRHQHKTLVVVASFTDQEHNPHKRNWLEAASAVYINNRDGSGIESLKRKLLSLKTALQQEITPVEGLVQENDFVLLVTPIDLAAPKGRLILPQVETIRDLLDKDCACLMVKERELKYFYDNLGLKPRLVITDSQVFSKVAADLPPNQPLTSFSILFARKKGDLLFYLEGIRQLAHVPPQSKILVLESCQHHRQADDIGTVKIPRLFRQLVQSRVTFEFSRALPDEDKLKDYFMVINCGGCMVKRNLILNRIGKLKAQQVYGINYGLFLAWVSGLLPRAIEPIPEAFHYWQVTQD
jgi:[FeFe] hydrogenase H-cluster maturation GTPase HydF